MYIQVIFVYVYVCVVHSSKFVNGDMHYIVWFGSIHMCQACAVTWRSEAAAISSWVTARLYLPGTTPLMPDIRISYMSEDCLYCDLVLKVVHSA